MEQNIIDCLKSMLPDELVYKIIQYQPKFNIGKKQLRIHKKNLTFLNIVKNKLKVNQSKLFKSIMENTQYRNEFLYEDDDILLYVNLKNFVKLSDVDFLCIYL